jgi:leukotriene-A4 hydrolase
MAKKNKVERDLSSLSNPHEVRVTHLVWDILVDFDSSTVKGTATYTLDRILENSKTLCLDTSSLDIVSVKDQDNQVLAFQLHKVKKAHLGQKLVVTLTEAVTHVSVEYSTTASSSALQWLPPKQTAGGKHPYLFTQCQAIHARSLVPCQDAPGVKITYEATVTVPSWAVCVMSAVLRHESVHEDYKVFEWEQHVPISSYLLAMAVGDLAKKDISERCAIWSEPAMVKAAAYEFAQTEDFLQTAESLAGAPYAWGRYDLLCLPPSFPYGGMENPCLTFVTPTLLAQDRSLADVVAHEIAHSWTGNLVTANTWDHFWLNEGWTTWFQRKIMARIHNDDRSLDFDALGGWKALQNTVEREMPAEFTKLVLPIGDRDPDEAYSTVAYEKGFNFLYYLEGMVGSEAFLAFFQAYVSAFSNHTVTSDDFRDFFMKHFEANAAVKDVDWETWYHAPGMPPVTPTFDRSLAEEADKLAQEWLEVDRNERVIPTQSIKNWSSNQKTCFLDGLLSETSEVPLKEGTVQALDKEYSFAQSGNAEILFRYCLLAIAADDQSMILVIMHFMTSQGRMKFVRPLYRAMFASPEMKDLAVRLFLDNKDFYHPIGAKMIASDLLIGKEEKGSFTTKNKKLALAMGAAVVAVVVGFVVLRRKR